MLYRTAVHHLAAATCLLTLAPTPTANACTGSVCKPDVFLPFEGTVPVSTYGIQWWPGRRESVIEGELLHVTQANDLTFRCGVDAGAMHDVAFHVSGDNDIRLITPDQPLVVGEQCEIVVNLQACVLGSNGSGQAPAHALERSTFTVTAAVDQPSNLGTLTSETARTQTITVGNWDSCSVDVPVCGTAITLQLDPSILPWADSLLFTTYVDDEAWTVQGDYQDFNPTGGSFVGRGRDLVFVATEGTHPYGLNTGGIHTIQIRANLVGTDTDVALETEPITVNLDCADVSETDASVPVVDASVLDAGEEPIAQPKPDGCACSVVRSTRTTTTTWIFLAVIAAFAVRRVRSSRAASRAQATRG